ncbi:hypothetical protein [Micromonospora thermarum]|uniref:Secreted protein n=1 Tax=Micromonospora thermarum TaxID=2720024 RepID=A0ABX0ZHT4_9ACTN|nr:hypothetical protein [Micromonospora thermarum]NJP35513.1 hypothetical protein [Micromonospora thermarum]
MLETVLAKLLTLKVAGATAVAAVATGGVALAATNGVLPNPLTDNAKVQPSPDATGKPSKQAGKSAEGKNAASPSPSLVGLCHAFRAGAGDNPGKALENPAFSALITAAGTKEEVAAFCDDLLAKKDARKNTPTVRPTEARPSHTAGKPDSAPTTVPSKPAGGGRPTTAPTASATS